MSVGHDSISCTILRLGTSRHGDSLRRTESVDRRTTDEENKVNDDTNQRKGTTRQDAVQQRGALKDTFILI